MVSSSKILTVSYGTFSCTAEGFEDPLAVVKETTHFFRGVVGEDRFFGAEPPQFDADLATEMMRERLSPEMGSGTLSLGQAMAAGATSSGALASALGAGPSRAAAPAPAQDSLPDDDTIEATAVLTERPITADTDLPDAPEALTAPEASDDDTDAPSLAAHDMDDSDIEDFDIGALADQPVAAAAAPSDVAAKLDRIRAVVAGQASLNEPEETDFDLPETTGEDSGDGVDDDALAALLSEYEDQTADDLEPEVAVEAEDALEDDLEDGLATVAPTGADDNLFADTLASLMADQEARDTAPEAALELPDMDAAFAYDDAEEDEEDDVFADEDTAAGQLAGGSEVFAAWDDDAEDDQFGHDDTAPEAEESFLDEDEDDDEDDAAEVAIQTPPPPPPAAPKPAIRARVVKVKRTVFEEAVKSGQLEEIEDDATPVPGESSLSPQEEDELARELAAVTAELDQGWDEDDEDDFLDDEEAAAPAAEDFDDFEDELDEDDEEDAPAPFRLDNPVNRPAAHAWEEDVDTIAARAADRVPSSRHSDELDEDDDDEDASLEALVRDSARKAVKMASPARAMLTESTVEDGDTSRILDETNKELDEPEGSRRRTAIAHLRAAVAATRADKLLGRKADADQEAQPYREDLANVVRPRRPQTAPVTRSERPAEPAARPAPLKLVAEQRVGERQPEAAPAQVSPVRPRRIRRDAAARAEAALEEPAAEGGFADYAASVGAVDLPELLEAAAAYMSFVEGREQFSRPQLMTTVRQAEQSESSREDRLRSFGQLLREGKIEKTSGGRFTASERIAFKPDRAAG